MTNMVTLMKLTLVPYYFSSLQLEVRWRRSKSHIICSSSVSETSDFVWDLSVWHYLLCFEKIAVDYLNTQSLENAFSIVGSRSHGGGLAEKQTSMQNQVLPSCDACYVLPVVSLYIIRKDITCQHAPHTNLRLSMSIPI